MRPWSPNAPPGRGVLARRALAIVVVLGMFNSCKCRQTDAPLPATWWEDRDGDGFGDPKSTLQAATCPAFYADPARGADCDDALSTVNPRSCDRANNGRDEDCDGVDGARPSAGGTSDRDGDGYTTGRGHCTDCNDSDPGIYPGARDATADGVDQDCDGFDGPPPLCGADQLQPGQLVITELFFDTAHTDGRDEWFEVFNASKVRLSTAGLQIRDSGGGVFFVKAARVIRPFGLLVLANASRAARFPGSQAYQGVRLRRQGALELVASGRVIDRVAWGSDSSFPFADGASITLYPWYINHRDNDRGKSWCLGRSRGHFHGLGTPGLENDLCIPRSNPATAWPASNPPGG